MAIQIKAFALTLIASRVSSETYSLFDLTSDQFESENVYSDVAFSSSRHELESRLSYFMHNVTFSQDIAADDDFSVFKTAGGAVPFVGDYLNPPVVPTVSSSARSSASPSAPTLVYVLMDDVGWNDVGFHDEDSTWLDFATPNMDALAAKGIRLTSHYTGWVCGPTRASLLTGKYPYRLGYAEMPNTNAQLPLTEVTMAQELQLQGYRSVLIGKWHLGMDRWESTPRYRGFDKFYGYYTGSIGYESKLGISGHFDLHDQESLVTDPFEKSQHLTTLLQSKVEDTIAAHAADHAGVPLFLFYAPQNVHQGGNEGMQAPAEYLARCGTTFGNPTSEDSGYCALMIMMDEAIGRTVCALENANLADNMLMVVASDNGGLTSQFPGVNWPQRGGKGSYLQGGIRNAAFVYASANLIPVSRHGAVYDGAIHVSDWLPTFLGLGSGGEWAGLSNGDELDGIDIFDAIVNGSQSPRHEVFHNYDASRGKGAIQIDNMKLIVGTLPQALESDVAFDMVGGYPETCLVSGDPIIVPSRAPTPVPIKSRLSCAALDWDNAAAFGDSTICSSSLGAEGLCSDSLPLLGAENFCGEVGGRLCTLSELENDETRGTGCSGDREQVWSSSLCGINSFWVAIGSSRNAGTECSPASSQHLARCCADVFDSFPTPSAAPTQPCADVTFVGTSKGYSDGKDATLTGPDEFDDSWMGRGFNVMAFSATTRQLVDDMLAQQTFDTYDSEAESNAMLSFLTDVPSGSLVVILAKDAVDHWSGDKNIGSDLKTYMSTVFGATKFSSLTFRESYGLFGYKGESSPLAEDAKIEGSGVVTLSVAVPCPGTPSPTMQPAVAPTQSCADITFAGTSKGYSDGKDATLTGPDGFDDSWMGRGFNVMAFSATTRQLVSQQTFDTYDSEAANTAMLSFLTDVSSGSLVVILAKDAVDHWSGDKNIGSNLKTYMSTAFGATKFSSLTFRESYGLIGYKGESSPLVEDVKTEGLGFVTLSVAIPCPGSESATMQPAPAPTEWCADITFVGTSKGYSDGKDATLTGPDGFDDSWMGRGFNVMAFSATTRQLVSQHTFDTYDSEAANTAMLSFLTDVSSGSLVVILAKDAVDHWSGDKNIGSDLKSFMSTAFGATKFSSLIFRESYGLIGYKGESLPLGEQVKTEGSGFVTLSVAIPCPETSSPTIITFVGTSKGYSDGKDATLTGPDGFDDSWMGRGFNVMAFSETTNTLLAQQNYDTYDSEAANNAMLSFLIEVPSGSLVVILVKDAVDHWSGDKNIGSDLKTYMSTVFGATKFSSLTFRESYGLIGYKGESSPLAEDAKTEGSGFVTVTATTSCL